MSLVRVVQNSPEPSLLRQTPGCSGVWDGIEFTLDEVQEPDYVAVINCAGERCRVRCDPERVWVFLMEPPEGEWPRFHRGSSSLARIYTSDPALRCSRHRHANPALPWHVEKTYDQLVSESVPQKTRALSWVTSSKATYRGHRSRLDFLAKLKQCAELDLFGYGFEPIEDKWDALAPYRYSIAVENHRNSWYWTEKIADCFLAWTMPIYFGCTQITRFFPAKALVQVDISDPLAPDRVREVAASDLWERNLDAIEYSRQLVLQRYQFFPFVSGEIRSYESSQGAMRARKAEIDLYELTRPKESVQRRVAQRVRDVVTARRRQRR